MPEPLKVFVRGAPGLRDTILSNTQGGHTMSEGLAEMVLAAYPSSAPVETFFEECLGMSSFRHALEGGAAAAQSQVFAVQPAMVLLSVEADLRGSHGAWGSAESDKFQTDLTAVVRLLKELGTHVFVVNASSVDHDENVSTYEGLDREPAVLRAHRYNLATMRVSANEGISVIDADRLVAEIGGREAVTSFLTYSATGASAISRELLRVIVEYGFMDNRPLLPQVGKGATG